MVENSPPRPQNQASVDYIVVAMRSDRFSVPRTPAGAEQLLHYFRARQRVYAAMQATAQARLLELNEYIHLFRNEVDRIGGYLAATNSDLRIVLERVRRCRLLGASADCVECNAAIAAFLAEQTTSGSASRGLHRRRLLATGTSLASAGLGTISFSLPGTGIPISVPRTPSGAHHLLHFFAANQQRRVADQNRALRALQELINYRTVVGDQVTRASRDLQLATDDFNAVLGLVESYGLCGPRN